MQTTPVTACVCGWCTGAWLPPDLAWPQARANTAGDVMPHRTPVANVTTLPLADAAAVMPRRTPDAIDGPPPTPATAPTDAPDVTGGGTVGDDDAANGAALATTPWWWLDALIGWEDAP